MKRSLTILLGLAVLLTPLPGGASHNADIHSDNVKLVTTWNDGTYRNGSDIAFWGNRAVFGNTNPGGFRLMNIKKPKNISLISNFVCNGTQSDVSIWQNLVFVSIDGPRATDACDAPAASAAQQEAGAYWEGVRIVSIADPLTPVQIKTVATDCGSHTNTLVPQLDHIDPATGAKAPRLLVYALSYPLGAPIPRCNQNHGKISVIEVPLSNPTAAKVIGTSSVAPSIGCHDVTYFAKRRLAAAACISESQLWEVSDPAKPKILSHIQNPDISIHHGTGFSWDGNTMVIADEMGGAVPPASSGCRDDSPPGSLWFYDVTDPANPRELSRFKIPYRTQSTICTAHNLNVVPLRKHRDILVAGWYHGGTTVVDFTNPAAPSQIAHYIPKVGAIADAWSSYWYNGRIYVNNNNHEIPASRGIDVFQVKHPFRKRAIDLPYLNPQTQLPFRIPKKKG